MKKAMREKILSAAAALAGDIGPGNLSLDAVAERAGVSKGGLLYHFPSKSKLLEALVEQHLRDFDAALSEKEKAHGGGPNSLAAAYIDMFVAEQAEPPPSGVLAALAENPQLLVPVSRFKRSMLDRLKENARDRNAVLAIFLAARGHAQPAAVRDGHRHARRARSRPGLSGGYAGSRSRVAVTNEQRAEARCFDGAKYFVLTCFRQRRRTRDT